MFDFIIESYRYTTKILYPTSSYFFLSQDWKNNIYTNMQSDKHCSGGSTGFP